MQRTLNNATSTSRSLVVSTSHHQRQPSTNPSLRSSTSSLAPSAVFSSNSSYSTPRSSLGHGTSLSELPEGIAYNDESNHAHWCTYGEHLKPTYTCEGWKRHEREHETAYLCMPNGPVESTQHGPVCALCHKADPDANHLAKHNISICDGKFIKKSRRTDMIKHLAQHRVHSKAGAALTDQWRRGFNKKYFSCGLCVMLFFSITDRSSHIDNEHWRLGQNMGAWELSNSIRGLLLEPEVQAAWRILLGSYPHLIESDLRWQVPLAEGLQFRLEMGEESGPVLARAALELSNYERVRPSQEALMATMGAEEMMVGPVPVAPRSPAAATLVPLSNSTYQPLPHYTQPRARPSQILLGSPSSSNIENSITGFPEQQCDPPLNLSAMFTDSFQPDHFYDTYLHPRPPMDPSTSHISSQLSTYVCPTERPYLGISQPLGDNTRIQGHLSESGALPVSQIFSPRHVQPAKHATIDGQEPLSDSRDNVKPPNTGRLPTSNYFHGWTAQPSNHEYGLNFRKKPLPPLPSPDLPGDTCRAPEHRPSTPMDLGTG